MESWLKSCGAKGLDDLKLADFPGTGRGVKTLRSFKQGDTILTIPSDVLWTVDHAYADPVLGPVLRSVQPPLSTEDILALYLLFVRSREGDWMYDGLQSHIAALPTSYSSSVFFDEEELEVCAGSSLYTVTKQLQQLLVDDYRALVVRVLGPHPQLFPLDKFTLDDYIWALCTVWSRSMDFALPEGKSIRLVAPFADMLNHSSEVKQCHVYDPKSGNLSILAGKDYKAGDQAFINYGPIPNNRLLRLYGFVIPGNPHDSYDLVLATHSPAPRFEEKQKLWPKAGLESTSTIALTLTDPLPRSVLRYLRIQRLSEADLAAVKLQKANVADEQISKSNESEVLQFLVESLTGILDGFGIQLERLEEQLAKDFYPVGSNSWAAAHVSLGEQRILRLSRKRAQYLLTVVDSGKDGKAGAQSTASKACAYCGQESSQLMVCGRCKSVAYCGRQCQVAHYKNGHKAVCKAPASGKTEVE
ncbi:Rubisco LS methyltransferase [Rhypophila decipiens]|uniref:Rubisco LS methyltransferase n=1 Tax=Rhypophila decipiens TaxID=261697 RepID=A0AAN7B8F2_9PEZI|nr:Rubisco LS methyltransferase [Rhypophila decipiens]